jgi:hypothetical protein
MALGKPQVRFARVRIVRIGSSVAELYCLFSIAFRPQHEGGIELCCCKLVHAIRPFSLSTVLKVESSKTKFDGQERIAPACLVVKGGE